MNNNTTLTDELQQLIAEQLGDTALVVINQGNPQVEQGWVYFWLNCQEIGWGIDTDPVLLMVTETGKEFTSFASLLDEINPF